MTIASIEKIGTSASDVLYGSDNAVVYGLDGSDAIHDVAGTDPYAGLIHVLMGGAGNDTYFIPNNSVALIIDSGGTDTINVSMRYSDTYAVTVGSSLAVLDINTRSGIILYDFWNNPPAQLNGLDVSYTGAQFRSLLQSGMERYYGIQTWEYVEGMAKAYGFDLGLSTTAEFNQTVSGLLTRESALSGSGSRSVSGTSGNDMLTGGSGISIDGLAGIDTVTYSGNRGAITHNANGAWTVGADTVTNVERLQFSDKKIALDLETTGHAGLAMEFIGAVAPSFLNDVSIRGTIISLFDQGYTMESLSQLALNLNLLPTASNADLANAVYNNVIGGTAPQDTTNGLVGYIDAYGQANFLATVAGLHLNVDLVGLQQTGVEYLI